MIPNELVRGAMEAALVVAIKDPAGSPKPLQPFLKFQKMPARAMPVVRKVLDTDDAFRERVASLVALDMLDRPAVLFLTRPDGWEDELDRLAADEAQAAADAEEAKAEKSAQRKLKAAEIARTKAEERVKELTVEVERSRALLEQERVASTSSRDDRAQRHVGRRQPAQARPRARSGGGDLGAGARGPVGVAAIPRRWRRRPSRRLRPRST